ncbi:hypothetical protein [Aeromonas hydrophila]|uniref:hypothetical protein n=1 Tax=Aeromonas hydrophila TaxID=644 RepID=UPI002B4A29B5|nr:hypothetical protein [Aeromonas hydrophila]
MNIEILDNDGSVVNVIVATEQFAEEVHPGRWRAQSVQLPPSIAEVVTIKLMEIKAEAGRRITALDWRLQRAQEREQLGEAGFETVTDVLALREQIRQASNAAEQAVSTLTDVGAVQAFTW